jgi:hypothetical protein
LMTLTRSVAGSATRQGTEQPAHCLLLRPKCQALPIQGIKRASRTRNILLIA